MGAAMTRFVARNQQGAITGLWAVRQWEGQEELSEDHADIVTFREAAANTVPGQVSAGQFIQALAEADLLDAVDVAVAQADALTQRLWARAAFFVRADPRLTAVAAALEISDQALDDIFRLAATK